MTTADTRPPGSAAGAVQLDSAAPPRQRVRVGFAVLLLSILLLQRVVIPLGSYVIPVVVPIGLVVIGLLALDGALRPVPRRAILFFAAVTGLAVSAYLAARYSSVVQIASLVMVVVVFAPWVFRVNEQPAGAIAGWQQTARLFVRSMVVLAVVGVAQLGSQLVGVWGYRDYVLDVVPYRFLQPNYNTSIPITWDSPIHKAQAFVFVEPSTFSQFTALALIVGVLIRAPAWQLFVLLLGLLSALSGTGLLLLGVGVLLLLLRAPRLIRPVYLLVAAAGVYLAVVTPAASVLSDRVGELDSQTSSLSLRFVLPYQEVADGLDADERRWVTGAGPGASDRLLESARQTSGLAVVYTIPAKLLFEYGLIAAVLFLAFLVTALFRAPPVVALPGAVLVWMTFLGGYLVVPDIVWTAWLLLVAWSRHE